jgi:hypothetical protein
LPAGNKGSIIFDDDLLYVDMAKKIKLGHKYWLLLNRKQYGQWSLIITKIHVRNRKRHAEYKN